MCLDPDQIGRKGWFLSGFEVLRGVTPSGTTVTAGLMPVLTRNALANAWQEKGASPADAAKPFNNDMGFERGFWQRYSGSFLPVPKTSVFDTGGKAAMRAQLTLHHSLIQLA